MRIPVEGSTSYRGRNARPNWAALLLFIGLALAVGAIGFFFSPARSAAAAAWYAALAKPPWAAPIASVPVWIVLYCLMGTAAWVVSRERYHRKHRAALAAYFVQLLLNAAWPPLFFGMKSTGAGFFTIVALWLAIAWTIREFIAVRVLAACLMLPYLAWVTFAMGMNISMWRLNP